MEQLWTWFVGLPGSLTLTVTLTLTGVLAACEAPCHSAAMRCTGSSAYESCDSPEGEGSSSWKTHACPLKSPVCRDLGQDDMACHPSSTKRCSSAALRPELVAGALSVVDVDEDPFSDLAYVAFGEAFVALGDGAGSFGEPLHLGPVADLGQEYWLVTAPLDDDGFKDIAIVGASRRWLNYAESPPHWEEPDSVVRWWARKADGGFEARQDVIVPGKVGSMIATDLDSVPPSELVVSSVVYLPSRLRVRITSLLRVDNDSLSEVSRFEGAAGTLIAIGTDKVVATDRGTLLGLVGGALQSLQKLEGAPEVATDGIAVELDGDANPDVVVIGQKVWGPNSDFAFAASAYLSNSDGTLRLAGSFSAAPGLAAADIDADGDHDLLLPSEDGRFGILPGRGDGTFDAVRDFFPQGQRLRKIFVASLEALSTKPEVLLHSSPDGRVRRLGQDCSL